LNHNGGSIISKVREEIVQAASCDEITIITSIGMVVPDCSPLLIHVILRNKQARPCRNLEQIVMVVTLPSSLWPCQT
jgi:hypothetical protein